MGWYVICEICREETKYRPECNCYAGEAKRNTNLMMDCKIEDSFITDEPYYIDDADLSRPVFLIQKLSCPNGNILYFRICIRDGFDESACWRKIKQITEDEYNSYTDSIRI